MSKSISLIFSSMNFMVSILYLSLIHIYFVFVYGVRKYPNFILLHVTVQFSQYHLLKKLSFLYCLFLFPSLMIGFVV